MRYRAQVVVACALVAAGCAETQYVYEPAVHGRAQAGGLPAAYYSIPATGNPTGDVRVTSLGVTEVQPSRDGQKMPAIHVRMIVANNSDQVPWTIDTRGVVLGVSGIGQSRPAFVNTDAGAPPIVRIPQGQRHVLDLYYPLPPNVSGENTLPTFDLQWRIQTGSGVIAQRTPFERREMEPAYARGHDGPYYRTDVSVGIGFGPYWWYDPFYPRYGFYRGPIIIGGAPYRIYPHHGFRGYYYPGRPYARGYWGPPRYHHHRHYRYR